MNRFSSHRDLTAVHRAAQAGHNSLFMCPQCARPAPVLGRRLRLVQGMRTWVCQGCAK